MLYVEPTPYILGLIRCIAASSPCRTEVGFCVENLSQQWNLPISGLNAFLLRKGALAAIFEVSRRQQFAFVELSTGWGKQVEDVFMDLFLPIFMVTWAVGFGLASFFLVISTLWKVFSFL